MTRPGILHLVADVADVVVAEVVVDADPRRRAEAEEKAEREAERAGREVERDVRDRSAARRSTITATTVISVPDPQRDGDRRDRRDAAVQQRDVDHADRGDEREQPARRQAGPDVAGVLGEADVARRDLQRPAQHELPDEEKRHQPPERLAAERFAQIAERAARRRHRGAELAPHHAVADDDHERDDPAEHRLRAAERRHEQRDRDERTDPDHVDHVERRGLEQAEAARQGWRGHLGRQAEATLTGDQEPGSSGQEIRRSRENDASLKASRVS